MRNKILVYILICVSFIGCLPQVSPAKPSASNSISEGLDLTKAPPVVSPLPQSSGFLHEILTQPGWAKAGEAILGITAIGGLGYYFLSPNKKADSSEIRDESNYKYEIKDESNYKVVVFQVKNEASEPVLNRYSGYKLYTDPQNQPLQTDVVQPGLAVCVLYAFFYGLALFEPNSIQDSIKPVQQGYDIVMQEQAGPLAYRIPNAWLYALLGNPYVSYALQEKRGFWPEALAMGLLGQLIKERYPNNPQKGFEDMMQQIVTHAGHNGTSFIDAIEMLDAKRGQSARNKYSKNIGVFRKNGYIKSSEIMMDFWQAFTGRPAMTYRLPWREENQGGDKKVLKTFQDDEKTYQWVKDSLEQKAIMLAYINRHQKVDYVLRREDGAFLGWEKEQDPNYNGPFLMGRHETGLHTHHNYTIIGTSEENGQKYIWLHNPHGPSSAIAVYGDKGLLKKAKAVNGDFKLLVSDFREFFYTITSNGPKPPLDN